MFLLLIDLVFTGSNWAQFSSFKLDDVWHRFRKYHQNWWIMFQRLDWTFHHVIENCCVSQIMLDSIDWYVDDWLTDWNQNKWDHSILSRFNTSFWLIILLELGHKILMKIKPVIINLYLKDFMISWLRQTSVVKGLRFCRITQSAHSKTNTQSHIRKTK